MKHTSNYSEKEITLPAKGWFITLSLIIGLLLNLLPIQGYLLILRPDFVALILLFWGIYQPKRVGISIAFIMGILMDVANSNMLGQHALAYSVLIFIALTLRQRMHTFGLLKQVPQIGLLLILTQFIILFTELLKRSDFPGWHYFLASLTGMLLWPLISLLIEMTNNSKNSPNEL
tara:strand:+ start:1370 stop:1894 length:525 start_codon:yes stop_codon:yes gene_type:complete